MTGSQMSWARVVFIKEVKQHFFYFILQYLGDSNLKKGLYLLWGFYRHIWQAKYCICVVCLKVNSTQIWNYIEKWMDDWKLSKHFFCFTSFNTSQLYSQLICWSTKLPLESPSHVDWSIICLWKTPLKCLKHTTFDCVSDKGRCWLSSWCYW